MGYILLVKMIQGLISLLTVTHTEYQVYTCYQHYLNQEYTVLTKSTPGVHSALTKSTSGIHIVLTKRKHLYSHCLNQEKTLVFTLS
jgi:hypothetical protein